MHYCFAVGVWYDTVDNVQFHVLFVSENQFTACAYKFTS